MSTTTPSTSNTSIQLVVGLGNPGAQYSRTRHNAGFWVVDEWARQVGVELKPQVKFLGATARVSVGSRDVWVLKPNTFMNKSGESIRALCQFYQIPTAAILVIHDELDLENGAVRLKFAGGHGGHNGLRDVTRLMGEGYWRLRMGIDHPGSKELVLPYVLGPPLPEQVDALKVAVAKAVSSLEDCCRGSPAEAMNLLNRRSS